MKRIAIAAGIVSMLALPFLGNWLRRIPEARCALDGGALVTSYRVRLADAEGQERDFCCIRCAQLWLERREQPARAIWVADETSGVMIEAEGAHFVRSLVVTTPTTGNRIHAFRDLADAERHAEKCRGTILTGGDRPFAIRE
jgi:hypothetical protein